MNTKQVCALILYVLETIICFIVFLGCGALLGAIATAKEQANGDAGKLALIAITEGTFVSTMIYAFVAMMSAAIGIILAAKKQNGQKILNVIAIIAGSYLLTALIVAFIVLGHIEELGVDYNKVGQINRFIIIVASIIMLVASIFIRYEKHRVRKCVFMIIPIGVTFILHITTSGENSSSAIFMALLTLGQLILAIMYLASKDEECGTDVSLDGKLDPVAELKRLESYLESGYISQEEYEQARQKYVDKL
jgi:hypothetical protein